MDRWTDTSAARKQRTSTAVLMAHTIYADPATFRQELHIEAQGSLLAIAHKSGAISPVNRGGGERGLVSGFSDGSRRRLIRKLARLQPRRTTFITLTYPARFPEPRKSKDHLRALLERFRRRYPDMSAIWRLEYQERGAPHFHLLCFNMPYLKFETLRAMWAEIISDYVDQQLPFVRIEAIRDAKGAMYYAAKYCAKVSGDVVENPLFNNVTYLHAGRVWGVFNRDRLPYAPKIYMAVLYQNGRGLPDAKKLMRRYWARVNRQRHKGAVIFTDKAYSLHSALIRQLIASVDPQTIGVDCIELG